MSKPGRAFLDWGKKLHNFIRIDKSTTFEGLGALLRKENPIDKSVVRRWTTGCLPSPDNLRRLRRVGFTEDPPPRPPQKRKRPPLKKKGPQPIPVPTETQPEALSLDLPPEPARPLRETLPVGGAAPVVARAIFAEDMPEALQVALLKELEANQVNGPTWPQDREWLAGFDPLHGLAPNLTPEQRVLAHLAPLEQRQRESRQWAENYEETRYQSEQARYQLPDEAYEYATEQRAQQWAAEEALWQ